MVRKTMISPAVAGLHDERVEARIALAMLEEQGADEAALAKALALVAKLDKTIASAKRRRS